MRLQFQIRQQNSMSCWIGVQAIRRVYGWDEWAAEFVRKFIAKWLAA